MNGSWVRILHAALKNEEETLARHQLDPQLAPERQILAVKEALLKQIRGQDKVIRNGEQYFMSCHCGATDISSNPLFLTAFLENHKH